MLSQVICLIALVVIAIFGYSFYSNQREKALAEKLRRMRQNGDSHTALSDVDAAISQMKSEAEFFRKNDPRHF